MNGKLIKLEDGTLVEVEVQEDEIQEISDRTAERVNATFDKVKPILLNACRPIADVWQELNKDMYVETAEVEIGFSFEGEGNIYITKAKASSNLKVKLVLKPSSQDKG
ncbi:CU044_2847 family protein [Sphaerothrix gracilis]|uniref:CU044_2847 family protein n=1 Tax=Sphaerothrix gracilis TaxID=3151835 RepID=UPI0031FD2C21